MSRCAWYHPERVKVEAGEVKSPTRPRSSPLSKAASVGVPLPER
jgi:hypothetical protein